MAQLANESARIPRPDFRQFFPPQSTVPFRAAFQNAARSRLFI